MNEIKHPQFVMATYQVELKAHKKFIDLLKSCEATMRKEKLITTKPIFRMQSNNQPQILIEIFEWVDSDAFATAQQTHTVLHYWKQMQSLWIDGGFGLKQVPESSFPWAQYKSI